MACGKGSSKAPAIPKRPDHDVVAHKYFSSILTYNKGAYKLPGFSGDDKPGQPKNNFSIPARYDGSAFELLESVVRGFKSLAIMMDSILAAMHNSVNALLEIADQVVNMKAYFQRAVSALSLMNLLSCIRRFILGFWKKCDPDTLPTSMKCNGFQLTNQKTKGLGLLLNFLSVVGLPYLVWKFTSLTNSSIEKAKKDWLQRKLEGWEAFAAYDYTPNRDDELALVRGQNVYIAPDVVQPQINGWVLVTSDWIYTGLVPLNHLINIRMMKSNAGSGP